MDGKRPWCESPSRFDGILQQGDAVARVDAHSHVLAVDLLEHVEFLVVAVSTSRSNRSAPAWSCGRPAMPSMNIP